MESIVIEKLEKGTKYRYHKLNGNNVWFVILREPV